MRATQKELVAVPDYVRYLPVSLREKSSNESILLRIFLPFDTRDCKVIDWGSLFTT